MMGVPEETSEARCLLTLELLQGVGGGGVRILGGVGGLLGSRTRSARAGASRSAASAWWRACSATLTAAAASLANS
jgi:hypothetical protein